MGDPADLENEFDRKLAVAMHAMDVAAGTTVVLLQGKPGVGKSTISAQEGGLLKCCNPYYASGVRLEADIPIPGVHIGHGAAAGTLDPACVRWQDGTHAMLDVAGAGSGVWASDAGSASELVNTMVLRRALQTSPFKIAVVLEESDLGRFERWDIFVHITNMIPDDAQLHSCVVLIVTKHTGYVHPDVGASLRHILETPSLPMQNARVRSLVKFFCDNCERVVVMPAPIPGSVGVYPVGPRDAIRSCIRSAASIHGGVMQLSLSAAAELLLTRMLAVQVDGVQSECTDAAALCRTAAERAVSAAVVGAPAVLAMLATAAQTARLVQDGAPTDNELEEDVSTLLALPLIGGAGAAMLFSIREKLSRLAYLRSVRPLVDAPPHVQWRQAFSGTAARLQQLAGSPRTHIIKDVLVATGWDGVASAHKKKQWWHEARTYERFITTVTQFPVASGAETWHEIRDGPVSHGIVLYRTGDTHERHDGGSHCLSGARVDIVYP